MKKKVTAVLFIVCVFLISVSLAFCSAAAENDGEKESDGYMEMFGFSESEILDKTDMPDVEYEALKGISFTNVADFLVESFKSEIKTPVKVLSLLCGIFILFSAAELFTGTNRFSLNGIICSAVTAYSLCRSMTYAVDAFFRFTSSVTAFLKIICPILSTAAAVTGRTSGALAYRLGVTAGVEILSFLCSDVIFYCVYLFFAVCVCSCISPDFDLSGAVNLGERTVSTLFGIAGTVFTGFLSIRKILGAGADTLVLRGFKFVAGSFVPFVGGAVSEGLSSVAAGLQSAGNGIAVWTAAVMCAAAVRPIVIFLAWSFVLRTAEFVRTMLCPQMSGACLKGFISFVKMMAGGCVFVLYIGVACTLIVLA